MATLLFALFEGGRHLASLWNGAGPQPALDSAKSVAIARPTVSEPPWHRGQTGRRTPHGEEAENRFENNPKVTLLQPAPIGDAPLAFMCCWHPTAQPNLLYFPCFKKILFLIFECMSFSTVSGSFHVCSLNVKSHIVGENAIAHLENLGEAFRVWQR